MAVRIALITHVRRKIGGTEAYVELLAEELHADGHDVALWHEYDGAPDTSVITLPPGSPSWSVESLGFDAALAGLRQWRPDVLFSNGVATPEVEASILQIAPTVLFVHAYHGACISGTKSRLSPQRMPCTRVLGAPCLLHYFPRRCGGWNPLTMVRRYALETQRRDLLASYAAILTASEHMRAEYLRYDLPPDRVVNVGLMIRQPHEATIPRPRAEPPGGNDAAVSSRLEREWRLLFVARLTALKGGRVLLDAIAHVRAAYDGRIVLTVAGEGPEREALEIQAAAVRSSTRNTDVRFTGWLDAVHLAEVLQNTDLLVVPSIWPEPFGLVGAEAGLHAVPAAAFSVGGIPDWLREGANGHLAPGTPPTAKGLASAIVKSLRDPAHYAALRIGALAAAREVSAARHMPRVLAILQRAAVGARREG